MSLTSGEKEEKIAEIKSFSSFRVEPYDDANGPKIMTKENLLDRHIHLHSHEIISGRWLRHRSKIEGKIFSRFACALFLGIGIIGVLWLQWGR